MTTVARRTHRFGELHMPDIPVIDGIPHDWIIDEQREAEMASEWDDAAGYMDAVKSSYRSDNWQDQPRYCEVWSEKAPALGAMRPITQEFGVMLRACRGFGSTGMEGQVGYRFEEIKKPITVFYLGDHDPSGHDIGRDIHHRAQQASGKEFEMIRQAIRSEDIKTYNLPPQRIKTTDSRAAGFKRRFRARAATVELDALPVEVLRQRVREAIEGLIDFDLWNRQLAVQQLELVRTHADVVLQFPKPYPVPSTDNRRRKVA